MGAAADVDRYMADLQHPLKVGIARLRTAILASNPEITEHVKWNAPSFRFGGDDRVTFRLHPGERFQVIFHRGAKTRDDAEEFTFADPSGLMTWLSPDRALVDLPDLAAVEAREERVVALINRWILV